MSRGLQFGLSYFQKELEKLKIERDCFSHPFLFQDDIHSIAYGCFAKPYDSIETMDCPGKYNMVGVRRLIRKARHQDYSEILLKPHQKSFDESCINPYIDAPTKGACLVLEMSTSCPAQSINLIEWKSFRSIHSVSLFMEGRLSQSNFLLRAKTSCFAHPETLIRMFRRRIQDVSLLNLLRLILHMRGNPLLYRSVQGGGSPVTLLWNFYLRETEFLPSPPWERFCTPGSEYSAVPSDQKNINRKEKDDCRPRLISLNEDFRSVSGSCTHYVRYKNHFLFVLMGTKDSIRKWVYQISTFVQSNSHCWFHSHQICVKNVMKGSVSPSGYTPGVRSRHKNVWAVTPNASYGTAYTTKEFFPEVPTSLSIGFMMEGGFRDGIGRSTSRSDWATLTDGKILNRFVNLWKVLPLYYSGSRNKDGLRKSRYISKLSCDKTLACKHKTTTRRVRQKLYLEFDSKNLWMNPEVYSPYGTRNMRSSRHPDLIRPACR
uniref:photosystem II protein K n=1 Tax=Schizaea pusilla TaxID=148579 RepID=UPI00211F1962|nr:photosystem II protein K [Schizaea pusilla]YP_010451547.1 maturase K [Schizaea pusilla]UTV01480.1 maturase K [Schizaea pusilla]UTV01481.1 photosystem II protein K [Schizaea pusilla]